VSLLASAEQLPVGSLTAVEGHLRDLLDAPEGRYLLTRYRCAVSPEAIREEIATYLARGLLGLPTAVRS
jgi:hypothetical protein